jgi:hypothetical protein
MKSLIGAITLALALPLAAVAAPITGQLDITGLVLQSSQFTATGSADFSQNIGTSNQATGDFDALVTEVLEGGVITQFTFTDPIDFTSPGVIYTSGDITFTATSFSDFDNTGDVRGFNAIGTISATGFDDTPGVFSFSTQGVGTVQVSFSSTTLPTPVAEPGSIALLAISLLGLGLVRRRRGS